MYAVMAGWSFYTAISHAPCIRRTALGVGRRFLTIDRPQPRTTTKPKSISPSRGETPATRSRGRKATQGMPRRSKNWKEQQRDVYTCVEVNRTSPQNLISIMFALRVPTWQGFARKGGQPESTPMAVEPLIENCKRCTPLEASSQQTCTSDPFGTSVSSATKRKSN